MLPMVNHDLGAIDSRNASLLPTRETLDFLEPHLGAQGSRVLEVGCGSAELAAALVARGHRVVALDSEPQAVARARERGVDARLARFPDWLNALNEHDFDVVCFGRVLHHLGDLQASLGCARELLRPAGRLIVEDQAWESVDQATADWVLGWIRFAHELGRVPDGDWDLDWEPLDTWLKRTRDAGLHSAAAMRDAIAGAFEIEYSGRPPYAYRWIARYFAGQIGASSVTRVVHDIECELIAAGAIVPIGWRAVARRS